MNTRHTWYLILVAGALCAFIFFFPRHPSKSAGGPARVLPGFKTAAITAIQVMPRGQQPIRVERTNDGWQLSKPVAYAAQSSKVETLLLVLEQLTPAYHLSESELTNRFTADQDYGFNDAQATLLLEAGDYRYPHIRIGAKTTPGDQVFLQVVGPEGIFVVDAALLQYLPRNANDWRDTALINLRRLPFDRITVTSGNKGLAFQSDPTNHLWFLDSPSPFKGRADNSKLMSWLQALDSARVQQFIPDEPSADVEALGLQPPEFELGLAQGTNSVALFQFGKSPTNDATKVYARRLGRNAIFTVSKELLAPWYSMQVNDYRDPLLVELTEPVALIEVQGGDSFSVQRQTNNTWRVLPRGGQSFPGDTAFVNNLLLDLTQLKIFQFTKENITDKGLGEYGLAPPRRQYTLRAGVAAQGATPATNAVIAQLSFSTNQNDIVFARRADELSVYAVKAADFERLAGSSYQLRERRIWNFTTNDLAHVIVQQEGRMCQINRNGPDSWSVAPGSQGAINEFAVEDTVARLGELSATAWVACGEHSRAAYGLDDSFLKLTFELKNGNKAAVEFGKPAPSGHPYAAVMLDGQPWVFEFPAGLFPSVLKYLSIP